MKFSTNQLFIAATGRFLRLAGIAALISGAIATSVSAAGLLTLTTPAEVRVAADKGAALGPEALRSRIVRIDRRELARHVAPLGMDTASDRIARAAALDGVIAIELFPDVVATFRRKDIGAIGDSGYAWIGEVRGRQFSFASLIVDGGEVTGHVQLFHRLFRIDPLGGGVHRVTEIDQSRFPPERFVPISSSLRPSPSPGNGAKVKTTIRILVAYTKAARTESGGNIVNEIRQAVSLANGAYVNSRVPIRLQLADIMSAGNYNESTGGDEFGTNLQDVTGNSGSVLSAVRTARETHAADLVALFRRNGAYCGIGWLPNNPGPSTSGLGYQVMNRTCVTNYSMHHEGGHNMGLHHDRYVDSPAPASEYHFGFVNTDAACRIRTVMAYNTQCSDGGFFCTRVNFFSTPRFTGPGSCTIGIIQGAAGAADNTRRLRETRTAVAAYR